MGFPFECLTLQNLPSGLVQAMLSVALSWIPLLNKAYDKSEEEDTDGSEVESLPSPSLVQVPIHFIVGSLKDRLPVRKYSCFLERLGGSKEEGGSPCAVCLKGMNARDEVRELCNCSHMFHRECLDGWVDQGQTTCPLCRSKLLPDQNGKIKGDRDPWRRERMIYLFGEDFCFQ